MRIIRDPFTVVIQEYESNFKGLKLLNIFRDTRNTASYK